MVKLDSFSINILRKMYFYRHIGGKHTSIDNLQKSFPKHERGNVSGAIKVLVKSNLVILKSTGYGKHCSLNPKMIYEVEKLIEG